MNRGQLGKQTFRGRWLRERARSQEIAKIEVGHKIVRDFAGQRHEVECHDGFWVYNGKEYATLYSVVCDIAGTKQYSRPNSTEKRTMSNWSASRFFALKART